MLVTGDVVQQKDVAHSRGQLLYGGLEVDTVRGDLLLQPSTPVSAIDARSQSGRIELVLPDRANFDLLATAERGEAVNDFGEAIHRDTSGRTNTLRGRVGDGPQIRLTATRGSVSVRKDNGESSTPPEAPKPPKPPRAPKPGDEVKM